jgi:nucleotide-binding universal stress UspA family protein
MFKKVLVPLDGSGLSECSLNEINKVASNDTQIVLMRIEEKPQRDYHTAPVDSGALEQAQKARRTDAEMYLSKVADQLKSQGMNMVETVYSEGSPAQEILDYTDREKPDLILMSSHGRTGISRWAMGSVADKILRSSTAPVLLIRPESCRI